MLCAVSLEVPPKSGQLSFQDPCVSNSHLYLSAICSKTLAHVHKFKNKHLSFAKLQRFSLPSGAAGQMASHVFGGYRRDHRRAFECEMGTFIGINSLSL
jgi:hypothetical protein